MNRIRFSILGMLVGATLWIGCGQEKSNLQMAEDFLGRGDLWNARAAFNEVVRKDKNHVTANFHLSWIEPVIVMRGFDSPLRTPFEETVESLKKEESIDIVPSHRFITVLSQIFPLRHLSRVNYAPRPNVLELGKFTSEKLIPAIDKGISHAEVLYKNQNLKQVLDASQWHMGGIIPARPELDWADALFLKSALFYLRGMAELFLAYDVSQLLDIAEEINKSADKSPKQTVAIIEKYPSFGLRQSSDHLNLAKGFFTTSLEALRDGVASATKEEDPQADELIAKDKLPLKFDETTSALAESIKGSSEVKWYIKGAGEGETVSNLSLDLSKFFEEGSRDLQDWLPEFDGEGKVTGYREPSFGGISPDKKLVAFFCSTSMSKAWCP